MEDWVRFWILHDPTASFPDSPKELCPELDTLVSIPMIGIFDIRRRCWANDDDHDRSASSRSRTSSHGIPRGPSTSRSSRRRSSSSRWAAVKGTSSSERLSQSCSRRRRRSSGLNRTMSNADWIIPLFYSQSSINAAAGRQILWVFRLTSNISCGAKRRQLHAAC